MAAAPLVPLISGSCSAVLGCSGAESSEPASPVLSAANADAGIDFDGDVPISSNVVFDDGEPVGDAAATLVAGVGVWLVSG